MSLLHVWREIFTSAPGGDVTNLYVLHHCFPCICGVIHLYVWRDLFTCTTGEGVVTWLLYGDVTPLHVWCEASVCVAWHIHSYARQAGGDVTHLLLYCDLSKCRSWLIRTFSRRGCGDVTLLHVWHDFFTCVTWLFHTHCRQGGSNVTHLHLCFYASLCGACGMTQSHVRYVRRWWRASFTSMLWPLYV